MFYKLMANIYDQFNEKEFCHFNEYRCSTIPKDRSRGFNELMVSVMTSEMDDNTDKIKETVKKYPHLLNSENAIGYTPLMLAVLNTKTVSNEQTVELLIDLGADVNATDNIGRTALSLCALCEDSSENTLYILLNNGANIDAIDNSGNNALMYAIKSESYVKSWILIDSNTCINVKNTEGSTALHLSVMNRGTDIMKLLLDSKGINVNIQDNKFLTPLMLACTLSKKNHVDILLTKNKISFNLTDHVGRDALILSALCRYSLNKIQIINKLLEDGANVNHKDDSDRDMYDYLDIKTLIKLISSPSYDHDLSAVTKAIVREKDNITEDVLMDYYIYRKRLEEKSLS